MKIKFFILTFFPLITFSQLKVDSILNVINTCKNDSIKIYSYAELADACVLQNKGLLAKSAIDSVTVIAEKYKNTTLYYYAVNSNAFFYSSIFEYDKSIIYHNKALQFWLKSKNNLKVGRTLLSLGNTYYFLSDFKKAKVYFAKSLSYLKLVNDDESLSNLYNNLAISYAETNEHSTARYYFSKSFEIDTKTHDTLGMAYFFNNIGYLALEEKDFQEAIINFEKALAYKLAIGTRNEIMDAYSNLGFGYFKDKNLKNAKQNFSIALTYSKENSYDNKLLNLYKRLVDLYESQQNYKEAFIFNKKYLKVKDSIDKRISLDEIESKTLLNEITLARKQDSLINTTRLEKQAITLQKNNFIMLGLIIFISVVIIFALLIFKRFKISQKQKKQIEFQKDTIERKQKEIIDSINYAKRIQQSILPSSSYIKNKLKR